MPDLLLELFSEEIPARMQKQAAADLQRLVTHALVDAGVSYEGAKAFATPRRLALHVAGLPARQPDTREERKGPRVGAPEGAVQGFLKSAGLTSLDQAKIESDPKKGEFYVAVIEKKGRPVLELLAEILPGVVRAFPWPKSMRWGKASASSSSLRWVRPLRSILATFGAETEETEIVPFDVDGIAAGNVTYGHRFLAPSVIAVRRFDDYVTKLEAAKVVLDADRRKAIIKADAATLAFAQGLEVIEDEGLLEEVAGLVEWPVVLMGSFEEAFLDVPGEVIRATIRANQKCFVLKKPDGSLANRFLLTSNIEAKDGGKTIVAGNERVIRARLSDAKFFWDTDRKVWKDDPEFKRLEKFKNVTFHEKLGSQWDRIERIRALAKELCKVTGADEAEVDLAAKICKLDLQTEVVGEFPEVQGLMGRIYAGQIGLPPSVAAASEEHYKPVGPTDSVPTDKVSVTLALADKLDTLVGFWAIDEKPTGSKDPYALRRAALGVIRLLVENGVDCNLSGSIFDAAILLIVFGLCPKETRRYVSLFEDYDPQYGKAVVPHWSDDKFKKLLDSDRFLERVGGRFGMHDIGDVDLNGPPEDDADELEARSNAVGELKRRLEKLDCLKPHFIFENGVIPGQERPRGTAVSEASNSARQEPFIERYASDIVSDLLSFFHDRLKVMLRDSGARHDLVDAVLANGETNDDLLLVVQRVEALGKFLETEDGKSLLAGYKRAANFLNQAEKKAENGKTFAGAFEGATNSALLVEPEEKALHGALTAAGPQVNCALSKADFEGAMRVMAGLRVPVDAFSEAVLVNADDPAIRHNRLALLATLRRVTAGIADFSRISG